MSVPIPQGVTDATVPDFPVFTPGGQLIVGQRPYIGLGAPSLEVASESVIRAIANKLTDIEAKGLLLTQEGFMNKNLTNTPEYEARRRNGTLLDVRAIQLALTDVPKIILTNLPQHLKRDKKTRVHTSYGLKHHLERFRERKSINPYRGYITNGDFIMAMLLLGWPLRRHSSDKKSMSIKAASLAEKVDFNRGSRSQYTAYMRSDFGDLN